MTTGPKPRFTPKPMSAVVPVRVSDRIYSFSSAIAALGGRLRRVRLGPARWDQFLTEFRGGGSGLDNWPASSWVTLNTDGGVVSVVLDLGFHSEGIGFDGEVADLMHVPTLVDEISRGMK